MVLLLPDVQSRKMQMRVSRLKLWLRRKRERAMWERVKAFLKDYWNASVFTNKRDIPNNCCVNNCGCKKRKRK